MHTAYEQVKLRGKIGGHATGQYPPMNIEAAGSGYRDKILIEAGSLVTVCRTWSIHVFIALRGTCRRAKSDCRRLFYQSETTPRPIMQSLRQFIVYGAAFVYPAVRGEMTVGFPTAHGVSPLKELLVSSTEPVPVWPHPRGKVRGMALLPLYEKLPIAAMEDEDLYALLSLFDALRTGQARERELAKKLLEERLQ